jgi:uncharacterized repeat protein (TIGR03803 family)
MRTDNLFIAQKAALALFTLTLLAANAYAAPKERVLYSFGITDGSNPETSLIFDKAGNLYGTTVRGGAFGYGTVFELTPTARGWNEKVLHSFSASDGFYPSASLIFDSVGNLYGSTALGGAYHYGMVFQLAPGAHGTWTETILHSFDGTDGDQPRAQLTFDKAGNLYGTTTFGGAYGHGAVFQLTPGANGVWTETVLRSFTLRAGLGPNEPFGNIVFDADGNLYGTTENGGPSGWSGGVVFELAPGAGGKWTEKIPHYFGNHGEDGYSPEAGLIFDTSGNLYSTTALGGAHNFGAVFQLTPDAGKWNEKVLHSFNDNGKDGAYAVSGLILDAAGNLYGTTNQGGTPGSACNGHGCGTVFDLQPGANGTWTEKILHSFSDQGTDGTIPEAGLIRDAAGNLYGTTYTGGANNYGTVFKITP